MRPSSSLTGHAIQAGKRLLPRRLQRSRTLYRMYGLCWKMCLEALSTISRHRVRGASTLLWVCPKDIRHNPVREKRISKARLSFGLLVDGDWDLERQRTEDTPHFAAYYHRYIKPIPWEETDYYHHDKKKIESGDTRGSRRKASRESFEGKLNEWDRIVGSMEREGYMTQTELDPPRIWDEVHVCIARDGVILHLDGRKCLYASKVLGLPRIPALIRAIHPLWFAGTHTSHLGQRLDVQTQSTENGETADLSCFLQS